MKLSNTQLHKQDNEEDFWVDFSGHLLKTELPLMRNVLRVF